MAHIKIEVDDKVLSAAEWGSFSPPSTKSLPRLYKIVDGAANIYFTHKYNYWISKEQLSAMILAEVEEEILPAPNVGFSEGFILRALAIAQDPKLAKELI